MTGKERRKNIYDMLAASDEPLSGSWLAGQFDVSRQVIVQDIALLRANGHEIVSTNRGYLLLTKDSVCHRVFKVIHSDEETEEEMNLIVDLGGIIEDVFVYHKIYGVVRGEMNLSSRNEIRDYMNELKSGRSSLLKNITSGYHYHTVSAKSRKILDLIHDRLGQRGFLAPLQDYEPVDFRENE